MADETELIPDQGLCSNAEAVRLLLGFPGDEEDQGVQQGVRAEGEVRLNGLLGHLGG